MGESDHQGSWGNVCGGWVVHYLDFGDGDVRTYQTVHFKFIQFIACQLYLNKNVKKGKKGWEGARKEGKKEEKEGRREEGKRKTEFSGVLEPAKLDRLFLRPHSVMLRW